MRSFRIAKLSREKIYDLDLLSVFYLAFAEMVEKRPPMFELLQVLGHSLREKNVTGIAAIHHSLRHVDACAGNIGAAG